MTAWSRSGPGSGWTSPLGLEGLLTNPGTPGGKDGGEANPTELHEGVQGAGGEAAAGWRQGAVGGGDGARHRHRAAQPVAHRAPGGRLGRGTGRPQDGAGGNAAPEARGEAARRGGGDPPQGGGFFRQGGSAAKRMNGTKFGFVSAERANRRKPNCAGKSAASSPPAGGSMARRESMPSCAGKGYGIRVGASSG